MTICAIATAPATAALGVIRVSGPKAFEIVAPLLNIQKITPRKACYCRIEADGFVYDEVIATFYPGPHSYTGEDVAELCCHGGLYVLRSVLELLVRKGCALAAPGEFSKRAFLNGKLDLIKAQAVIDLIEAGSRAEQQNALAQLQGGLSSQFSALYEQLVDLNTELAAYIDFPDEVDPPEGDALSALQKIGQELDALLEGCSRGRLIEEGLTIALVGAPNVGKSTLMNRLLGYDRSIVSDLPGTTRDTVTETCSLGDLKCRLADTAGIRQTADPIEQQGIEIARDRAAGASAVFVLLDGSRPLNDDDKALIKEYGNGRNLAILNKADLPQKADKEYIQKYFKHIVELSAKEPSACWVLDQWVRANFSVEDAAAQGVLTSAAQIQRVTAARAAVEQAAEGLAKGFTPDLITIDIEEAAAALGAVTGQRVTDETIDRIFSRFCVGK